MDFSEHPVTSWPLTTATSLSVPEADLVASFLEYLTKNQIVDERGIARAERASKLDGTRIDHVLNKLGLVSDEEFAFAWSECTGLPIAKSDDYPIDHVAPELLPSSFLRHARIVPLRSTDQEIDIAVLDPLDTFIPRSIEAKTGRKVILRIAVPGELLRALDRILGTASVDFAHDASLHGTITDDLDRLRDLASDAPVIRLFQMILERAVDLRASDIHLSVSRRGPSVRLRVDGILREEEPPPLDLYNALISRIKILAGLDIAESRLPQDGSARAVIAGREIDLRIATMPHIGGEGAVLRLLDRSSLSHELDELGIDGRFVLDLKKALSQPNGLILMTGPTGSGKTTTLYAALKSIARIDRNVVTIEDPVEYQLDAVTQIEVNHRIGLDFSTTLRAVLRQDPDVILIGEIRDSETAAIAARAAMTGHLVLASVHTNSAASALPRLIDMGVEPYMVASTVRAIMGQRLVRKLCTECRAADAVSSERFQTLTDTGLAPFQAFKPVGCFRCTNTGFRGRIAVSEFIGLTEGLRHLILTRADAALIQEQARSEGMGTLADNALSLIMEGTTCIDEVERVLGI